MRKVLATDLDGTLFYPKRRVRLIDKNNLRILKSHVANDGHLILVTGRNYPFINKVFKKIGTSVDIIACNGAFVKAGNKILKAQIIEKNICLGIYQLLVTEMNDFVISLFTKDGQMAMCSHGVSFFKNILYRIVYNYQGTYAEKYLKGKKKMLKTVQEHDVFKILLYCGIGEEGKENAQKIANAIKKAYPTLEIAVEGSAIEITAYKCTKAEGLAIICEHYGYQNDDLVVIGDSANDITMFDVYPNSVCMSHATKEVQEHAKYVVDNFYDVEQYLLKENEK